MLLSKEQLESSLKAQKKFAKHFKKELNSLEKGKIVARDRQTRVELFQVIKENRICTEKRIFEKEGEVSTIVNNLRRRWCIEKSIALLEKNINCIERALKGYKTFDPYKIKEAMPKSYKTNYWQFDGIPAGAKKNIISYPVKHIKNEFEVVQINREINNNQKINPEGLIYDTGLGFRVRSKSEVLIAIILHNHGLTFQYEPHIFINGKSYLPDFIILDADKNLVIWEHFGIMDNKKYAESACKKIVDYLSCGLVFGKNFMITSETKHMPLDVSIVEEFANQIAEANVLL